MKSNVHNILASLISCLMLTGCYQQNKIDKELISLSTHKVSIPFESLYCVQLSKELDNSANFNNAIYKIVVFIDSTRCLPCTISGFARWNEYLYSNVKVSSAFIIEIPSHKIKDIKESYANSQLDHPIYIDTCGAFRKCNPFIPDNSIFHTLLLNESDSIILIGNPLNNEKIAKLYKRVLFEKEQVSEKQ